jgi:hypothetical protein
VNTVTTTTKECRRCEGTGEIDTREVLDMDDPQALLAEILSDANLVSDKYGLRADDAAERCRSASRLALLVSRLGWLYAIEALDDEPTAAGRRFELGDLVYLAADRAACSICDETLSDALGVVISIGYQDAYQVHLIHQSTSAGSLPRITVSSAALRRIESTPEIIHASPETVADAIGRGWLEPGSEFHGCQFRR